MVIRNSIRVADQVWIALALLHRAQPERDSFTPEEIIDRVRQEFRKVLPGHRQHVSQHCVAIKQPNSGRYRMLHQVSRGEYRLFREGAPYHPDREGGKICPQPEDLPARYIYLLEWYNHEYVPQSYCLTPEHPLLKLLGIGDSGLTDVSEEHDRYLVEALPAESPDEPAQ